MIPLLASALFIFGPSCGGKSTLSKALIEQLGPTWVYLERDLLIEDGAANEEEADDKLEEAIAFLQAHDQDVLIDTQIPWRQPRKRSEKYVLVYAPLPELIARDARRTQKLERTSKRAHYARLYVEETFSKVFEAPNELHFEYDAIIDSSQMQIEEEIKQVLALIDSAPITEPLNLR
ncbi:MAG: AAA family ATPase [Parachlamydiales bacterium]|nr:AAA family ATPase [Candidatus Acheromyda pituitae]